MKHIVEAIRHIPGKNIAVGDIINFMKQYNNPKAMSIIVSSLQGSPTQISGDPKDKGGNRNMYSRTYTEYSNDFDDSKVITGETLINEYEPEDILMIDDTFIVKDMEFVDRKTIMLIVEK